MKHLNHLTNFVSLIAAILVTAPAWSFMKSSVKSHSSEVRSELIAQSKDVLTISPAIASGQQGNLPRLNLCQGSGLNLSFPIGEYIQKVWLDDPSRITVDFDASINSKQARSIHLRRINPLKFDNLPQTNTTLLTVVTNKNRYQFIIGYGKGTPQYYGVTIASVPHQSPTNNTQWVTRVRSGLRVAQAQGLISPEQGNTILISRVHLVLGLVSTGVPLDLATSQSGVSMAFMNRLEQMGQIQSLVKSDSSEVGDTSFEPWLDEESVNFGDSIEFSNPLLVD